MKDWNGLVTLWGERRFGSGKNGYGIERWRRKSEEEVVVCVNDDGKCVEIEDQGGGRRRIENEVVVRSGLLTIRIAVRKTVWRWRNPTWPGWDRGWATALGSTCPWCSGKTDLAPTSSLWWRPVSGLSSTWSWTLRTVRARCFYTSSGWVPGLCSGCSCSCNATRGWKP